MQFVVKQKIVKRIAAVFEVLQSPIVFRARHLIDPLMGLDPISIEKPPTRKGNRIIVAFDYQQ
jgi:hypothetical protein